jgi:antitoxin (DNA-binding transcriptional repressor) of toxin-antitoxin stability system
MNHISKSQFKTRALEFFRKVEMSGEPLIVTDRGAPVLEIRPYQAPEQDALAKVRAGILFFDNSLEPVGEDDWEALG